MLTASVDAAERKAGCTGAAEAASRLERRSGGNAATKRGKPLPLI